MSAVVSPASSRAPLIASSCSENEVRSGILPCFVVYTPTIAAWRLGKGIWVFVSLPVDDDQGVDGLGHLAVDPDRVDVDRFHLGEFQG